jgi:hypothetical protein
MASETEIMMFRVCLAQFGFISDAVLFCFGSIIPVKLKLLANASSPSNAVERGLTNPAAMVF